MRSFRTDFIGIGAAKCGTTWLHHCLEEHPEICMPSPKKEPGFYDNHWDDYHYYEMLFRHRNEAQILGEFTPGYLSAAGVAKRIASHNPRAKIIFIVRNPIERAYSHFCMLHKTGVVRAGPESITPETRMFRDSMYWTNFSEYAKRFPRENILVLVQEEMLAAPAATLNHIFKFLEVDSTFVPLLANKRIHSRSSRPKYQKVYRQLVALSDLAQRNRFSGRLVNWVKARGVGRLYRLFDKGETFPKLTDATRAKLRNDFMQDVSDLYIYLNSPIQRWQRDFPGD